jgi:hypothetical protein
MNNVLSMMNGKKNGNLDDNEIKTYVLSTNIYIDTDTRYNMDIDKNLRK